MKKMKFFVTCLFLTLSATMFAQNVNVRGTVTDSSTGEVVPYAAVQIKGTTTGTATDLNGAYTISVPANATLVISSVGYQTQEVAVEGRSLINVILAVDTEFLDDVIVVAYGTASKASLTGAVAAVDTKTIEQTISSSVTAALEGAAPGVQVNNTYGEPGSDPTIRIRGFGSINGSNAPLYIVDGFPFNGNISDLNSNDIESMTVLKDATSAALYGNRASNGVILITTKTAKNEGKPVVTLTTNQGAYVRGIKEYERLAPKEWMEAQWTGLKNYTMTGELKYNEAQAAAYATKNLISDLVKNNIFDKADDALFDANGNLVANILPGYTDLDWEKELVKTGYRQEYGIAVQSSSDKYNVYSSLDYMNEDGYILNTGFKRLSGRINTSYNPVKWFKTGLNLAATSQTQNYNSNAYSSYYANPFYTLRYEGPVYPVYLHNADGSIVTDANGDKVYDTVNDWRSNRHIIYERLNDYERNVRTTLDASAFATIILPYGFDLTVKGNQSITNRKRAKYDNPNIGDGANNNGRFTNYDYYYKTTNFQQQLNWGQDFGLNHVDALLAHESYQYNYSSVSGMNTNMALAGLYVVSNFTENSYYNGGEDEDTGESYLGRIRYNYAQKYYLDGSFRRDGSSRFSPKHRWGNFWSIGGAWDITKENFMKDFNWVNFLKLRASYGAVGNKGGIDYYAYQALYELDKNGKNPALYRMQLSADEVVWERTQTLDLAVEGRVFDRLNFSVGYFNKVSKDLLFEVALPASAGQYIWGDNRYMSQLKNIGSVRNSGWEISLDADVVRTRDFRWNIGTDATFLKNKILVLPHETEDADDKGFMMANGSTYRAYEEGRSLYEFYTYQFVGIDKSNGLSLYTIDPEQRDEAEADGFLATIDGKDYTTNTAYAKKDWIGSALPKVYGSVHTDLSWKNLTLHVLATYSLGGILYDSGYASLMSTAAASADALHVDMLKSWTPAQAGTGIDPNGIPVIDHNLSKYTNSLSSRWFTSASYLVLKNITLSYSLPTKLMHGIGLQGISINAGVENAFTLTARQGLNPQYSFSGGQDATYTTARIYNAGLTIKF